jgi:hypothetical protein
LVNELSTPDTITKCETFCEQEAEPMCPAEGTARSCEIGCSLVPGLYPMCATEHDAFISCRGKATYTCDDDGNAETSECLLQALALLRCADEAMEAQE